MRVHVVRGFRLLFSQTGYFDREIVSKQLHNAFVIQFSLMARICRNREVSYNYGRAVLSALAELLALFYLMTLQVIY